MPNPCAKSTNFAGHFFANMAQAPSQQPVRHLHTSLSAGLSTGLVDSAKGLAKKTTNTREALRPKAWSTLSTALPQCLPTGTVEGRVDAALRHGCHGNGSAGPVPVRGYASVTSVPRHACVLCLLIRARSRLP